MINWILWAGFLSSSVGMGVGGVYALIQVDRQGLKIPTTFEGEKALVLLAIFGVLSLGLAIGSFVVKRKKPDLTGEIIAWAMCEAIAIHGLVLGQVLKTQLLLIAFTGLAALCLILHRPALTENKTIS